MPGGRQVRLADVVVEHSQILVSAKRAASRKWAHAYRRVGYTSHWSADRSVRHIPDSKALNMWWRATSFGA